MNQVSFSYDNEVSDGDCPILCVVYTLVYKKNLQNIRHPGIFRDIHGHSDIQGS